MKKVLIAGGSHSEMPVICAAKNDGYFVITTGDDEASIGHKLSDKYIKGDYSDHDFIYNLALQENVDGIISGANDYSYLSTSYACDKLNFKGHDNYEVSQIIHKKNKFREALSELYIKTPKIIKVFNSRLDISIINEIEFPVVVKPVDLTGGKGVNICYNYDDIAKSVTTAFSLTRENYIIIEEYINGTPHGFSSFIVNQKVVWHIIDNEEYGLNKYLVKGAYYPSNVPNSAEQILINDIEKFAKRYNLVDGLFHVQFILQEDGYPIMIDPCRRMPGDLYVLLAQYATGINVPLEIFKYEMGINRATNYICEKNNIARECIMCDKKGKIKNITIDKTLENKIIYRYMQNYKNLDITDPMKFKAGILLLKFDKYDEMLHSLNKLNDLILFEME